MSNDWLYNAFISKGLSLYDVLSRALAICEGLGFTPKNPYIEGYGYLYVASDDYQGRCCEHLEEAIKCLSVEGGNITLWEGEDDISLSAIKDGSTNCIRLTLHIQDFYYRDRDRQFQKEHAIEGLYRRLCQELPVDYGAAFDEYSIDALPHDYELKDAFQSIATNDLPAIFWLNFLSPRLLTKQNAQFLHEAIRETTPYGDFFRLSEHPWERDIWYNEYERLNGFKMRWK